VCSAPQRQLDERDDFEAHDITSLKQLMEQAVGLISGMYAPKKSMVRRCCSSSLLLVVAAARRCCCWCARCATLTHVAVVQEEALANVDVERVRLPLLDPSALSCSSSHHRDGWTCGCMCTGCGADAALHHGAGHRGHCVLPGDGVVPDRP
jgi:hypothetical protein